MKKGLRRLFFLPFRPLLFLSFVEMLRAFRVIPTRAARPSDPPRLILVVNITAFLGDTVMMLPFLDRLHAWAPSATIDLVTSQSMAQFAKEIPYLDRVYEVRSPKRQLPVWSQYQRLGRFVHLVRTQMSDRHYDFCFLPRWGTDAEMSVFLARLTSSTQIAGHDPNEDFDATQPFPGTDRLLDLICHGGHGLPEGVRELRLIESLPNAARVDVNAEASKPIDTLIQMANKIPATELRKTFAIEDGPYIVLSPGASSSVRQWSPSRYSEIAKLLYQRFAIRTLVVGARCDLAIGANIVELTGDSCLSLVGRTNLIQLASVLSHASLVIANDSGPAHLAAGLAAPTLIVSACPLTCKREIASSPFRVRPVGPFVRVLQPKLPSGGCGDVCLELRSHCILGVSVQEVFEHAVQMLKCKMDVPVNYRSGICSV